MKAYRLNDKIKVKVNDIEFKMKPLSFEQRTEVQSEIINAERNADPLGLVRAARLAMKYSIKEQSGISYGDGTPFELKFDSQENLTDECLDELYLSDSDEKLKMICITLAKGFPTVPVDDKGKPVKGVTIETSEKTTEKK